MSDSISDEEAVDRIRNGDPNYYETLATRHQRRLTSVARRVLRNEADAEDAVQDAHLLAWQHIGQFAGRSTFVNWLASVTFNAALTQIRRRKERFFCFDSTVEHLRSPARDPEQQMMDGAFRRDVHAAVSALPDAYRAVFNLRDQQELSTEETGRRLGLTKECVKTRLLRARRMVASRFNSQA